MLPRSTQPPAAENPIRTILTILCLAAWLEAGCADVDRADQVIGNVDELCFHTSVRGLPTGTGDATGIAVITRRVLSDLTESESVVIINLVTDPLAVTTPLPAGLDTLVVVKFHGMVTSMVWERARQIADLGYRRVRILWSFGC